MVHIATVTWFLTRFQRFVEELFLATELETCAKIGYLCRCVELCDSGRGDHLVVSMVNL